MVDGRGHALYLFEADTHRKSACYGQCAAVWLPLSTTGAPLAGTGVRKALLTTAKRRDGRLQIVYAGHPLYLFSGDTRAGQLQGEGIEHFGGGWYVVDAAGKKVEPKSATTTPGYGGGYGP